MVGSKGLAGMHKGCGMAASDLHGDLATRTAAIIREFWSGSDNRLGCQSGERAWDEPLIGFSRGDDAVFQRFKEVVDAEHWTPWEAFREAFPGTDAKPGDLTVICWVLPQTRSTRTSHRRETDYPSEGWVRSYTRGEEFNVRLRSYLVEALARLGVEAVAPSLSPGWHSKPSDRWWETSLWSERHIAYASGLGTFGLCDGLITPVGKAVRIGSVVARIQIPATPRPYDNHHAYCLFFAEGTCGKCMARCPAGAITESGHDKAKCKAYKANILETVQSMYGVSLHICPCGLCQVGVPCESGVPGKRG